MQVGLGVRSSVMGVQKAHEGLVRLVQGQRLLVQHPSSSPQATSARGSLAHEIEMHVEKQRQWGGSGRQDVGIFAERQW